MSLTGLATKASKVLKALVYALFASVEISVAAPPTLGLSTMPKGCSENRRSLLQPLAPHCFAAISVLFHNLLIYPI